MTDVVLSAEEHFEALRGPVWARFRARHAALPRERFDDAYSEWWTREVERAADGRPSRAAAPVAYVCEAVHRVMIDEARSRARGVARADKAALQIGSLEEVLDSSGDDDTEAQARYEALAHRVLSLVRDRLTPRELQVFVSTYLYLRSTEATAELLGLSVPRVKKDRAKVAGKLGAEVWALLSAELEVCRPAREGSLSAVFEVFVDHAEDCSACSRSMGGLQRGALAVVGPLELLSIVPPEPAGTFLTGLYLRACEAAERLSVGTANLPGGGRGAAAALLAAAAVAGGGAAAGAGAGSPAEHPAPASAAPAAAAATPSPPAAAAPATDPAPARIATSQKERSRTRKKTPGRRSKPRVTAAPPPQAPAPAATAAPAAPAPSPPSTPAPAPAAPPQPAPPPPGEFGFERE